nr:hypothetical protein [Clostridia bacterium]
NNDLAIDLFEIDTLELDKSWWHQQAIDSLTIGGHLYFAPGNIGSFDNLSVFSVFVNKNMLEDFNLESPYDAVREGTWTMDMMYEMANTVAADIDGDGTMGEADRFGMSSEGLGDVVLRSCGERLTTKDDDDMPVLAVNTERAASIIEKVVPRWRDKAVTLYTGDFSSKYSHVFSQFLVPMFKSDQLLFVNNWLSIALEMRSMDSDFGILPPPKYDEAQETYYVPSSEAWTAYAAVPVTNPDLEFTGDIMNALGYYGREFVQTALIDTTITNKTLRDTDTEEMLQIIFDNRVFDLGAVYDWNKITTTLNQFISQNNTAFASKMASVESAVLSEMEKTIDSLS